MRGQSNEHGGAAEDAVRAGAALLGLPDLVYTVPRIAVRRSTREAGDALLIANGAGAIVQVKSRHPDAIDDGASWLLKHGRKAVRQAEGSRRMMIRRLGEGAPLVAVPERVSNLPENLREQAALTLDQRISSWPTIVVIDHPGVAGQPPPDTSVFWITLEDWEGLMAGLRSVTSLLGYVRRVLAADPPLHVALGDEQSRFLTMAAADARVGGPFGWLSTATYEDPLGAQLYRELVERVWPHDRSLPSVSMADYRMVVEHLDAAPPGLISVLGRWLLRKRGEQEEHGTASGLVLIDRERIMVYLAETWTDPECESIFDGKLAALASVRSAEASAQLGRHVPALAVGVLVAPGEHIDYRYAMARGPVDPSAPERRWVLHTRGAFDVERGRCDPVHALAGEPCPCGSGMSFGECGPPT